MFLCHHPPRQHPGSDRSLLIWEARPFLPQGWADTHREPLMVVTFTEVLRPSWEENWREKPSPRATECRRACLVSAPGPITCEPHLVRSPDPSPSPHPILRCPQTSTCLDLPPTVVTPFIAVHVRMRQCRPRPVDSSCRPQPPSLTM